MKNDLNIIAKLKYNEEKARTEKEKQLQELQHLKKDIKWRVDILTSDLINLNNIKPLEVLDFYYKNKYELIDLIYYNNDLYKNYDLETIKTLINDILYDSLKEIEEEEEKALKEDNKHLKDKMLEILIEKAKEINYQYPLNNYKLIFGEFWNMNNINNLKLSSSAINEYKRLFKEEIKQEKEEDYSEEEEQQPRKYGLGLFGYCFAFLVAIIEVFGTNKRR